MKMTKKISGFILLLAAFTVPVFAWGPGIGPMGPGFGMGPHHDYYYGYSRLTDEQVEKIKELHETFDEKTAEARTELMKKQIDLNAELNRKSPDIKKAKAIQKDINMLQAKITDAHLELDVEMKKINPEMPYDERHGKR